LRRVNINRVTKECEIKVDLNIDGKGNNNINTGIKFLDHLIDSLAKHAMFDLNIIAISKDNIIHHLIEDTAIALANAIDQALNDRRGIARFGYSIIPMDEALARTSIDLVRRSYYKLDINIIRDNIEGIAKEDIIHFLESFLKNLNACIHIIVEYGDNDHHKLEAAIKSFAIAFKNAKEIYSSDIPSTKGVM
jgi:imidazoleglycerol-phosphate dehydratase